MLLTISVMQFVNAVRYPVFPTHAPHYNDIEYGG